MIRRLVVFRALRPLTPNLVGITTHPQLLYSTRNITSHEDGKFPLQDVETQASKIPEKDLPLSEQVRAMMRRIPHPLTVITAQSAHSPLPSGLLVSSFSTITLSPSPYVSFNLKLPSSTYSEIQQSRTFVASAISKVELAKDFLLDKKDPRFLVALDRNVRNGENKLQDGRGGISWMKCQYMERESVKVADHVVVIGKVTETGFYSDKTKSAEKADYPPLIYSESKYRFAGEPIE
ncbi:MAG: hypothetical protein L6R41_000853 [Letrouitia leprolyta]|nr:MAG: hypothetical protein L6R41_000853 [Letrouitia leprolyta]